MAVAVSSTPLTRPHRRGNLDTVEENAKKQPLSGRLCDAAGGCITNGVGGGRGMGISP